MLHTFLLPDELISDETYQQSYEEWHKKMIAQDPPRWFRVNFTDNGYAFIRCTFNYFTCEVLTGLFHEYKISPNKDANKLWYKSAHIISWSEVES